MAPTAGNQQLYTIIDITDDTLKEKLSVSCDNQPFISKAKLVLIFCADCRKWYKAFENANCTPRKPEVGDLMLAVTDTAIAAQNAVTAAHSLGIGSCYIGDIMENYEIHKELLNLPNYTFPAAMITLGYYPENMKRTYRDRFDSRYVVFEESYKNLSEDELKDMFLSKESNMPKTNPFNAKTYGELIYNRKTNSEFSKEMDRSIREAIKCFTNSK
jgi:nitroreductase